MHKFHTRWLTVMTINPTEFGADREHVRLALEEENIELGGLTIRTTIDSRVQQAAEAALDRRLRELERTPNYPHQTRAAWRDLPADRRNRPTTGSAGIAFINQAHSARYLSLRLTNPAILERGRRQI